MALLQLQHARLGASNRHIAARADVLHHVSSASAIRCSPLFLNSGAHAWAKHQSRIYVAATEEATAASLDVGSSSATDDVGNQDLLGGAEAKQQNRAIIIGDKPAANSLLRRLEQVPQTLVRSMTSSDQHTYKVLTTVAKAQGTLNQPGKVLLYVPFTKGRTFSAIVLTTSSRVQQKSSSGSITRLQVKSDTNADALARTLSFDLIKHGTAMVESSGAAASARAAAALQLVRQQLLTRGYEVGVIPCFEERKITVLSQQVVLQELPVPCINLPRNDWKPLNTAAAAAQAMLVKQRRVQLLLPSPQLGRLSGVMAQVMQPGAKDVQQQEQVQQEGRKGRAGRRQAQDDKKRLLLVWPPSTADQLLESLEQLNHFSTTTSMAEEESSASTTTAAGLASAQAESEDQQLVQLQLRRSRLVTLPPPAAAPRNYPGSRDDRKPAVATAESSASGLAGAIEARVTRTGAAWLVTDGSKTAGQIAWEALLYASSKMDAADGAGGLLAIVDVQQAAQLVATPAAAGQNQQNQQAEQPAAPGSNEEQQPLWQVKVEQQAKAQPQQQLQQHRVKGKQQQQQQPEPSYKLKMLIVRDSDIARSILQSPNTPLEVSVSADLWPLLKFATAANTFLPVSRSTGTGGLVMLPAVLPAPAEPAADAVAADYRFDDQKQQLVPYAIRLQRFTGKLSQGMEVEESQQLRVSLSTDPIKLRDAIVAKVLQQQPASVRFVGPLGRAPPLLSIAMAAVAAARVRLQQKGAAMDVGVMPDAETLTGQEAAAASDADTDMAAVAGSATGGKGRAGKKRQGSAAAVQAGRVVYSLRLVPMPAVAAAATSNAAPETVASSA